MPFLASVVTIPATLCSPFAVRKSSMFSLMSESMFGGSLATVHEGGNESNASMNLSAESTHNDQLSANSFGRPSSSGGTRVSALKTKKTLFDMLSSKEEETAELPSAQVSLRSTTHSRRA